MNNPALYKFIRRFHTYAGLVLLAFFLKYGVSAITLAHGPYFQKKYKDMPQWTVREKIPFAIDLPKGIDQREAARQVLEKRGMDGAYGAWFNGNKLNIHRYDFWSTTRVTYYMAKDSLLVEDKTFRWDHFLNKFHWRGGYQQDSLLNDFWAVCVDILAVMVVLWSVSGIIIWWHRGVLRRSGMIVLGSGLLLFVLLFILM